MNIICNFPVSDFASLISCVRLNFYLELKLVCDVLGVKLGMTVLSNPHTFSRAVRQFPNMLNQVSLFIVSRGFVHPGFP